VDFLVEGGVEMILLNMFFAFDWLLFGDVEVCGRILEGWDSGDQISAPGATPLSIHATFTIELMTP
jgi:hypothetical protein